MMSKNQQQQPTIRVEHIPNDGGQSTAAASRRNSASPPTKHRSKGDRRKSSNCTSPVSSHHNNSSPSKSVGRCSPHAKSSDSSNNSMLSKLQASLNVRRKSSPAIPELGSVPYGLHGSLASASALSSTKSNTLTCSSGLSQRRLSSPPSLDKETVNSFKFTFSSKNYEDCGAGDESGSSNGSLNKLSISGLNPSSSDVREHTVISGHKNIGTLYAPNNMTLPESISINMLNAPGDSTVQCDCGHINCPLCNLMMNLELTDPSQLM